LRANPGLVADHAKRAHGGADAPCRVEGKERERRDRRPGVWLHDQGGDGVGDGRMSEAPSAQARIGAPGAALPSASTVSNSTMPRCRAGPCGQLRHRIELWRRVTSRLASTRGPHARGAPSACCGPAPPLRRALWQGLRLLCVQPGTRRTDDRYPPLGEERVHLPILADRKRLPPVARQHACSNGHAVADQRDVDPGPLLELIGEPMSSPSRARRPCG